MLDGTRQDLHDCGQHNALGAVIWGLTWRAAVEANGEGGVDVGHWHSPYGVTMVCNGVPHFCSCHHLRSPNPGQVTYSCPGKVAPRSCNMSAYRQSCRNPCHRERLQPLCNQLAVQIRRSGTGRPPFDSNTCNATRNASGSLTIRVGALALKRSKTYEVEKVSTSALSQRWLYRESTEDTCCREE